ncbi:MAG: SRPBCC family protein [Balneolaceae bacterium]
MREENRIEEVPELGATERTMSVLSGSYLMYKSLSKNKSLMKAATGGYLLYRGVTGHCPVSKAIGRGQTDQLGDINITTSLTINKPRSEVYQFWRKLENLPLVMEHLESVTMLDDKHSEWVAKIPGDMGTISWKSEIVEDEPGVRLGWQSLPDSAVENTGTVNFRDAGKFGTEVRAVIAYKAPLGSPGENVAKLLNPVFKEMVRSDIKNFKRYLETHEMPVTEKQQ